MGKPGKVYQDVHINLKLSSQIFDQVKAIAERDQETPSFIVRRLLRTGIEVENRKQARRRIAEPVAQ